MEFWSICVNVAGIYNSINASQAEIAASPIVVNLSLKIRYFKDAQLQKVAYPKSVTPLATTTSIFVLLINVSYNEVTVSGITTPLTKLSFAKVYPATCSTFLPLISSGITTISFVPV